MLLLFFTRNADTKSLHCITELILLFAFGFLTDITAMFPSFSFESFFSALYIRSERSGHCVEKRWSTFPEAGCVDGSRTAGQCHGRYSSRAGRVTGPAVQNVLSEHWALLKPTTLNQNPSLHSTAPDRSFLTERNNVNVPSGNDLMYVQDSGLNAKPRFFSLKGAALHSFGGHPSPSIALRGCIWRRF